MEITPLHPWTVDPAEAKRLQLELRERLVLRPPPGLRPRTVAGADLSMDRGSDRGFGGVVVLDVATLVPLAQASAEAALTFPYVPGLLSFRELPPVAEAWDTLRVRPDVLIFDGQGYAHPRRFGVACYGGLLFGLPSVGGAKSILVGRHGLLPPEKGARLPLEHRGEVVGAAVRLRERVNPVYVSPGHLIDLDTAVAVVQMVSKGFREPETTRRAHALVNAVRRAAKSLGE